MTDLRVLVVDDEPQILRFLRPALEASGYQVLHAAAGREALRLIANSAPDMIVLDLGLPDMDGKEVLAQARAGTAANATLGRALPHLERALAAHYEPEYPCC